MPKRVKSEKIFCRFYFRVLRFKNGYERYFYFIKKKKETALDSGTFSGINSNVGFLTLVHRCISSPRTVSGSEIYIPNSRCFEISG